MLAYDVGVYDGADTAHYLTLGYRVIGVEASPDLCEKLRKRFQREIQDGRYTLLNFAIGERDHDALPFWLSENPQWNSFDRSAATREGKTATQIDVPTRTTASLFKEFGVPNFLKIDIEGFDHLAVQGMGDACPGFISFEADKEHCDELVMDLYFRGYRRFSLIEQRKKQPIQLPLPGTLAHVKWSTRQWLRWQLRHHPRLHKTIAGARARLRWAGNRRAHAHNPNSETMIAPTLTPMEHQTWHSAAEFLWLWRNVVTSGMVDSSWFDVHAAREK